MQSDDNEQWLCPSFNCYSSNGAADVAGNVTDDGDDDFEFSLEGHGEEGVYLFPIFNRDFLSNTKGKGDIVSSLEKLFITEREEHETTSSSSSEEAEVEEMKDSPQQISCFCKKKVFENSPNRCSKSKSTGSGSKRWKIPKFMRRCNSDNLEKMKSPVKGKRVIVGEKCEASSVYRGQMKVYEASSRKGNEITKRKTYLPYRQDLLGFFTTVNKPNHHAKM